MRTAVLAAWVIGCSSNAGSGTAAERPPPSETEQDPHASREAIVRAALARLAAGDAAGVVELSAAINEQGIARAFACSSAVANDTETKDGFRRRAAGSAKELAGVGLEVVAIAKPERINEIKAGAPFRNCTVKLDVVDEAVDVTTRVKRPGHPPRESTTRFGLVVIGGRYFLESVPNVRTGEYVEAMQRFEQDMCSCSTQACATEIATKLEAHLAKLDDAGSPTPEETDTSGKHYEALRRCQDKLTGRTPR